MRVRAPACVSVDKVARNIGREEIEETHAMASHEDLQNDWSTLCQECHSCWTESDLQLAAELGKTLLERNKELENCIKLHQCTIDDQTQEIEYMKKQTAALREVNDSRLKIYEQLEVSIQDLERANQRLALENTNDKKQIKSQCLTIDILEARVDELQKKFDELKAEYERILRKQQIKNQSLTSIAPNRTAPSRDGSTHHMAVSPKKTDPEDDATIQQLVLAMANAEDMTKLQQQLQESYFQCALEQKKVGELEDQRDTLLQENAQLEEQLSDWKVKAQDMKNLQDEINTLEEVRQGHLCGRCLRSTNARIHNNLSLMLDQEEDDEISLAESLASSMRDPDITLQELNVKAEFSEEDNCNPYRVLVEKYEALLRVHQKPGPRCKFNGLPDCMSLQQELQMSAESDKHESGRSNGRTSKKLFAATPTDFSEAETSSSGFSDETSNKSTQTDGRLGSLLCSIADGDDCKFSIYDDSSTFESRFHKTPEYRKLFSEIFEVLKRAAVAKDEGMELPLLNDPTTVVEERTTYVEDCSSELTDDTRSVASVAVSSIASEPVFRVHTPLFSKKPEITPENGLIASKPAQNNGRRHQPLEYLSLQVKKKNSAKKSMRRSTGSSEALTTPDIIPTANPRVVQLKGTGRRRFRQLTATEISDGVVWNGNTAHFYPSRSPRGRQQQQQQQSSAAACDPGQVKSGLEYKPGTAAEEVAKLRRLEMSYAEVLRMPNKSKGNGGRHRRNH